MKCDRPFHRNLTSFIQQEILDFLSYGGGGGDVEFYIGIDVFSEKTVSPSLSFLWKLCDMENYNAIFWRHYVVFNVQKQTQFYFHLPF